jgi:hypothetical protein
LKSYLDIKKDIIRCGQSPYYRKGMMCSVLLIWMRR